jgi:hypothetical protein
LNPLNTIRTKFIYEEKHYQCTKAELNKTGNTVVRNYSCQMIKRRDVGGEWVVGADNKTPKKGEIMTTIMSRVVEGLLHGKGFLV